MAYSCAPSLLVLATLIALVLPQLGLCVATATHSEGQENFDTSLSTPTLTHEYDVFVSFRGEDTRTSFTAYLFAAFDRKRIRAYRDDVDLLRGGEIGPELLKAIEISRIALVVFSKNYATSRWCPDELVKIMECKRLLNQSVMPIFYDVSQSVVLEQKEIFAEAFLNGPIDKVNNWRTALKEAANLAGLHLEPHSATTNAATASTPRTTAAAVQNGSHVHPQLHGAADAPVTSTAAKPAEPPAPAAAVQRSPRPVLKAPTSQSSAMSSDPAAALKTPVKAPGDASKPYPLQFGSISPGFMNGMQVPARTSSVPPHLDKQTRDQARHDSFRRPPPLPIPTAPKQQFPRKDAVAAEQSNTGEAHSVPKVKKDVQVSHAPPASQPQKPPVLPPMGGMSMPMQYHQPQVSVQFAGPNQQLQSQANAVSPTNSFLYQRLSKEDRQERTYPITASGWQSIRFNLKFAFSGPGAGYISQQWNCWYCRS